MNPLKIIATEESKSEPPPGRATKKTQREEAKAKFERLWLIHPEQFNPDRNAMERERIQRTKGLIHEFLPLQNASVADLGCGSGMLVRWLAKEGAQVKAVDIASNALKLVEGISGVTPVQDYVPYTTLPDEAFDLVISTDLIGYLPPDQYRLYVSELARLMHAKSQVVCSTAIDIDSEDALQRFATLAETEFHIVKWVFSHHALYIRLLHLLGGPSHYVRLREDRDYQHQQEKKQNTKWKRFWFQLNRSFPMTLFWTGMRVIVHPFLKLVQGSNRILLTLERICRFVWSDAGISHALFIGMRKPLVEHISEEQLPQERKHKREVWE